MKNLLLAVCLVVILPVVASAAALTESEVASIIKSQSHLSDTQVASIVSGMKSRTGGNLQVQTFFYSQGINFGLCLDSDHWTPVMSYKDSSSQSLMKIPGLYDVYYQNGGVKIEACYKWVLVFLVGDLDVNTLDGAVFGRGFALNVNPGIGVELGWLPGANRAGSIFIVAPKLGISAGIQFPKMTFQRKLQ